jgi:hypothetical protein
MWSDELLTVADQIEIFGRFSVDDERETSNIASFDDDDLAASPPRTSFGSEAY